MPFSMRSSNRSQSAVTWARGSAWKMAASYDPRPPTPSRPTATLELACEPLTDSGRTMLKAAAAALPPCRKRLREGAGFGSDMNPSLPKNGILLWHRRAFAGPVVAPRGVGVVMDFADIQPGQHQHQGAGYQRWKSESSIGYHRKTGRGRFVDAEQFQRKHCEELERPHVAGSVRNQRPHAQYGEHRQAGPQRCVEVVCLNQRPDRRDLQNQIKPADGRCLPKRAPVAKAVDLIQNVGELNAPTHAREQRVRVLLAEQHIDKYQREQGKCGCHDLDAVDHVARKVQQTGRKSKGGKQPEAVDHSLDRARGECQ